MTAALPKWAGLHRGISTTRGAVLLFLPPAVAGKPENVNQPCVALGYFAGAQHDPSKPNARNLAAQTPPKRRFLRFAQDFAWRLGRRQNGGSFASLRISPGGSDAAKTAVPSLRSGFRLAARTPPK